MHWRTDANLYPPKDNSPKPVNHHLTLKEGPKVKSDNIRRFPAHDILQVGFTLQTSRINNKWHISILRLAVLLWPWRRGSRSNLTSKDSQPMISYKLVSHYKPLGLIISNLQALFSLAVLVWPWRRGPRSNLTTSEDSQPMISYKLVSHCKPLGPIISEL